MLSITCTFLLYTGIGRSYLDQLSKRVQVEYVYEVMMGNLFSATLAYKADFPEKRHILFDFLTSFWFYGFAGNIGAYLGGLGQAPGIVTHPTVAQWHLAVCLFISYAQDFPLLKNFLNGVPFRYTVDCIANMDLVTSMLSCSDKVTNVPQRFWISFFFAFSGNAMRFGLLRGKTFCFNNPDIDTYVLVFFSMIYAAKKIDYYTACFWGTVLICVPWKGLGEIIFGKAKKDKLS